MPLTSLEASNQWSDTILVEGHAVENATHNNILKNMAVFDIILSIIDDSYTVKKK